MAVITASRYHDISVGHRVSGHESKCRHLHGHNYRIHFDISVPSLDSLGRVLDFSVIKSHLCMWLEAEWDHKFLLWNRDPLLPLLQGAAAPFKATENEAQTHLIESLVITPFNPTAENMAQHLLEVVGPKQLRGTGATLTRVVVEETRKCSAVAALDGYQILGMDHGAPGQLSLLPHPED